MEISEVREFFPYLKTGQIYFNHAATGPLSSKVVEALNGFLTDKSTNNIDDFPGFLKIMTETKEELGRMLNTKAERIAFTDNTTNGINIVAQGIRWKKGDRILLNDIEFPANVYPFLNLQKEGVEIDFVKSKNGVVSSEDVLNAVKPETRLIAISYVQFLSGYRADLEKIGMYCRKNGIIFSVDAIQGLGAVRLDVKNCNIDFLSVGTQKWMLGLQGLAFIYVSEDLQPKLEPKYVGWLSVEDAWNLLNFELTLRKTADAFQNGTVSTIGVYALHASLGLFKKVGYDKVQELVLSNTNYLMSELNKIGVKPLLYGLPDENLAGIVTFEHTSATKIFEELGKKNIHFSVREGKVRLAPHFYNTPDEIDKVVLEIKNLVTV